MQRLQNRIERTSETHRALHLAQLPTGCRDAVQSENSEFLRTRPSVSAINWYLPFHENSFYAGVFTVLRFASRLAESHKVNTRIVIYDQIESGITTLRRRIESYFPPLTGKVTVSPLPNAVSIATFWMSAYVVAQSSALAKYYFIQDYEPLFYPAGTLYGLAEATYRLGLIPIVNTPGLLKFLHSSHGQIGGTSFVPTVDRSVYFPKQRATPGPLQIVFYGRPEQARNGFELGIETLKNLKRQYGDRLRIVSAGADWSPREYGLEGVLENRGRLRTPGEVADLYRGSDIGLCFMFSKHPSYQPFEMISCGCVVVSNENEATSWFFKDGQNCILAQPTMPDLVEKFRWLIENEDERQRIALEGPLHISSEDWPSIIDRTCIQAGLLPPTA
jgi:O-antigen biosynthesis protein